MSHDPLEFPADLPVPQDDGAADHLPGVRMPRLTLPTTDGSATRVDQVPPDATRLVLYAYPRTGQPGVAPLTPDWDLIPGARGCTPQACGFRDHAEQLRRAGAAVAGLSTQDTGYQRAAVDRLHLPFPLLSDADLGLTRALRLPTFEVTGQTLLRRLTLVIRGSAVEHVFYPVFPPDRHADVVLNWLSDNPVEGAEHGRTATG
jgi:peroxiredoxin